MLVRFERQMIIVRHVNFPSIKRIATVLLVSIAWFALSNHCVLGAACAPGTDSIAKSCPMHMKSSGKAPAKEKDPGPPCCKTLRAVIVAKINASANTLDFIPKPFLAGASSVVISRPSRCLHALDTGPPGALSFSEIVLQRSILAHAPPFLA